MSRRFEALPVYKDDELICSSVEAAKSFYGLADANLYFASLCQSNPDFAGPANNVYHYKDYYINVGKRFAMAGHADCLMKLSHFELSCVPECIAYIWLDNDEDMVLFTRVKRSGDHRLMACSCPSQMPEQARRKLLADADRLMKENYAVLALTEEPNSWHFLEGEDRIIFSNCALAYVSDQARAAYRKRVLEKLDLKE